MLEQQGRVLEQAAGMLTIRIGPSAGCPACDAGKGCGAGLFGRLLQRKAVLVQLENSIGAKAGDAVTVGIPESLFLRLLLRLYLWPLLMGLAGAGLGNYLATRWTNLPGIIDGFSLLLAVISAGLSLAWNRNPGAEPNQLQAISQLKVLAQVQTGSECTAKVG